MYLTLDIGILLFIIGWLVSGWKVFKSIPNGDSLLAFTRYHPRLAPIIVLALIVFWPISRLIWNVASLFISNLDRYNNKP